MDPTRHISAAEIAQKVRRLAAPSRQGPVRAGARRRRRVGARRGRRLPVRRQRAAADADGRDPDVRGFRSGRRRSARARRADARRAARWAPCCPRSTKSPRRRSARSRSRRCCGSSSASSAAIANRRSGRPARRWRQPRASPVSAARSTMRMRSRPRSTQPRSSKLRNSRETISRTLPSSSASAWCVALISSVRRLADQQRGKPLVELLVGDRLDDLHQRRETLAEQRENMAAERFVLGDQRVERRRGHDQQIDLGLGDAGRVVLGVAQQAAARKKAGLAGLDAVELQLAAVGIALQHADGARREPVESPRRASAR